MDFISELKKKSDFIEAEIYAYLPLEEGYQKTLFSAMNYSYKVERVVNTFLMQQQ